MEKPVIILGAAGIGAVALDIFKSHDVLVYGFLEDDDSYLGKSIDEVMVLGKTDNPEFLKIIGGKCDAFVSSDDNRLRKSLVNMLISQCKTMPVNAIHSDAIISKSAKIGHGNFINAGVVLGSASEIGNHCIINTNAIIEHNAKLSDYVQVGAGSIICPDTVIGQEAFLGAGVTIVAGIIIGKRAQVGAGSVVISNIKEGEKVFGNPAKPLP